MKSYIQSTSKIEAKSSLKGNDKAYLSLLPLNNTLIVSAEEYGILLEFASSGDTNGVVYYIGSDAKANTFSNPHPAKVTNSALTVTQGSVTVLTNRAEEAFSTSSSGDNWIKLDLGPNRKLRVNKYTMRNRGEGGWHIRNWNLQGSNDDTNWTNIDVRVNDSTITSGGQWGAFNTSLSDKYRYLRIIMTGNNSSGNRELTICEYEFYGLLFLE